MPLQEAPKEMIQIKEDIDGFNDTTYTCTYMIANIANMIAPILPHASEKIKEMLSLPEFKWEEIKINGNLQIENFQVLYGKIDEKDFYDTYINSESILKKNKSK